jgi:hypothetical protein
MFPWMRRWYKDSQIVRPVGFESLLIVYGLSALLSWAFGLPLALAPPIQIVGLLLLIWHIGHLLGHSSSHSLLQRILFAFSPDKLYVSATILLLLFMRNAVSAAYSSLGVLDEPAFVLTLKIFAFIWTALAIILPHAYVQWRRLCFDRASIAGCGFAGWPRWLQWLFAVVVAPMVVPVTVGVYY